MQVGTQSKDESTGAAPERSANGTLVTRWQFAVSEEKEDTLKCSCRSCGGVLLADCIALSCCPCAVVNFLALACLKVPWVVGRKCLRVLTDRSKVRDERGRKKGEGMEMIGVKSLEKRGRDEGEVGAVLSNCIGEGEGGPNSEGELAWLELDQVAQWGFGRVSFSGISMKIS